jgi:hypothetical protein
MKVKSTCMLASILLVAFSIQTRAQSAPTAVPPASSAAPVTPAAPTEPAKPAKAATKPKRDWYPFHGEVTAVDKDAMTITLKRQEGARVLHMDSSSQLARADKPLILADVKIGEHAQGKLRRNKQGEEVIASASFTNEAPAKPEKKDKPAKKAAQ